MADDLHDPDYDVVVVGAGIGGMYAVHRLTELGHSVLGFEAAPSVGGVWFHNRYPGARVDVESYYFCYYDADLYREWQWTERYPAQPEILAYLNFAADRWGVREHIRFSTRVIGARWQPERGCYVIRADDGSEVSARHLVMTTGQLSKARKPPFPGLDDFTGQWIQTSHWPSEPVETDGKRIGVIGTGSTGVQVAPALARSAEQLYVFQRTPNFTVPAHNQAIDAAKLAAYAEDVADLRAQLTAHPAGILFPLSGGKAAGDYDADEQRAILEDRWAYGGHTMNTVFSDQGTRLEANTVVVDFFHEKVRDRVHDPEVAQRLLPDRYPLGARRLCLDSGYYETFNRPNVTLVDVGADPIERITPTGVHTRDQHYELDILVFAIGFDAFTGSLDAADIRNEKGEQPSDRWSRGPLTHLGLMTHGFPNLYIVTGPGSPSLLANMFLANMQHVDLIGGLLGYMREHGYTVVEPTEQAEKDWSARLAEVAAPLIRLQVDNFMVHVNADDKSRVFIPYAGGFGQYDKDCEAVVANGYEGFEFR